MRGTPASGPSPAWRFTGTRLPDGADVELWVERGRFADRAPAGAEPLPGRFVLPGLVDAHCHLAVAPGPDGPRAADHSEAAVARREAAARGVLAVRDVGAPRSVTLALGADPDGALLLAAGRFLAPPGQYVPALHDAVEPERLVEAALAEVARGATWVKLVADFPHVDDPAEVPVRTYDDALVRELVAAVHAAGARVAAHTGTAVVSTLVGAGIDSVEHGTAMDEATLAAMRARGTAWTPTLSASMRPMPADAPQWRRDKRAAIRERFPALLRAAVAGGVPVLTGTDVAGPLHREVALLAELGVDPVDALAAATTTPRSFLGLGALAVGDRGDLVTYDADPRDDPEVLATPAAVVLGGRRLR